jgi:hypothetical protein
MIKISMEKARIIAHEIRREVRQNEFAPYDKIISAQIPGQSSEDAELARSAIRAKYAKMQMAIDAAKTPEEIKAALEQ